MTTLDIIIPVFNEAHHLEAVISKIRRVDIPGVQKHMIVVDDGSTDESLEIAHALIDDDLLVVSHKYNLGKGAAIRTALQHIRSEIVIIQDADLEYSPADYPLLILPIKNGSAQVVYGNRFHAGRPSGMSPMYWAGNLGLTAIFNLVFNQQLADMETCLKAFSADVLKVLPLKESSFTFEPEVSALLTRRNIRIEQVPITYFGRARRDGKKIRMRDGVKAIVAMLKIRVRRSPDL